jgi:hypothetical protein
MPSPINVVATSRETDWSDNFKLQKIKMIPSSLNPNKKAPFLIPYAKYAISD